MARRVNADIVTALALILGSAAFLFFVVPTYIAGFEDRVFPRLISICLLGVSALLLLRSMMPTEVAGESALEMPGATALRQVILIMVLYAADALLIRPVGFYWANLAFLPACMVVLGVRRVATLIAAPVVLVGGIYLFMEVVMGSPLPRPHGF